MVPKATIWTVWAAKVAKWSKMLPKAIIWLACRNPRRGWLKGHLRRPFSETTRGVLPKQADRGTRGTALNIGKG
jgi:hypothetical protein